MWTDNKPNWRQNIHIYNIKLLEHTQQQQLFMCTGGNTQLRTLITWAAYSWQHLNHQGTLQLCQDLAGKTDLVRQERAMTIKRKRERESVCVCANVCNMLGHWTLQSAMASISFQKRIVSPNVGPYQVGRWGCLYHLAGNHQKANFITVSTGSPFQSYLTKIYYLL